VKKKTKYVSFVKAISMIEKRKYINRQAHYMIQLAGVVVW
jgi:hypothetical protein